MKKHPLIYHEKFFYNYIRLTAYVTELHFLVICVLKKTHTWIGRKWVKNHSGDYEKTRKDI